MWRGRENEEFEEGSELRLIVRVTAMNGWVNGILTERAGLSLRRYDDGINFIAVLYPASQSLCLTFLTTLLLMEPESGRWNGS